MTWVCGARVRQMCFSCLDFIWIAMDISLPSFLPRFQFYLTLSRIWGRSAVAGSFLSPHETRGRKVPWVTSMATQTGRVLKIPPYTNFCMKLSAIVYSLKCYARNSSGTKAVFRQYKENSTQNNYSPKPTWDFAWYTELYNY